MKSAKDVATRMSSSINTSNESSLHRSLKALYSLEEDSRIEVPLDGKIYDVVNARGDIIEIQTHGVSSLRGKIETALANGRRIKIVHPVAATKTIESYTLNGELVRRTKSPSHKSVYNMWEEITGLTKVLLHPCVTLEILEIEMTKKRVLFDRKVQSPNRNRKWLRPWVITDSRLDKVLKTYTFNTASSYLALLPRECPEVFCAKDVATMLAQDKTLPSSAKKQASCMLWVLSHMGLIELEQSNGIKGKRNTKYYKITKAKA